MPGNAIPPVLRGDIYLLLELIGLERYSDISLTVIVCYANDCERATVQLSQIYFQATMLIPRYFHGLTPNAAEAVYIMYSLKRVCGSMNIQQINLLC